MGQKTRFLIYILMIIGGFQDLLAETKTRCIKPVPPENGDVHFLGEPKVGRIASYSCSPGLKLLGSSTTKCLITGQWTFGPPKCLSPCSVPQVENGEMSKLSVRQISRWRKEEIYTPLSEGEHVDHDVTLSFRCNGDFGIVEGNKILEDVRTNVTCYDGKWSRDLHCRENTEQSRPVQLLPLNGEEKSTSPPNHRDSNVQPREQCHCTYVGAGYYVQAILGNRRLKDGDTVRKGRKVTFSCRSRRILTWENGFRAYANASMTCTTCQRWEVSDNPDCKVLEGGGPVIMLDDYLEIQPGGAVEVEIKKPITLRCVSTYYYPQWSFRGQPAEVIYYSTRTRKSDNIVHYFSNIYINEVGYENAGLYICHFNPFSNIRHTVVDVRVKDIVCPFFPAVQDRKVRYSNDNQVGSRATFSCPTHATLVGSATSDCRRDGTWSSPGLYCIMPCFGDPPEVENGRAVIIDKRYRAQVVWYRCDEGTKRSRIGNVRCLNGTWTGMTPKCDFPGCWTKDLNFPNLVKPLQEYTKSSDSFRIVCKEGYGTIKDAQVVTCIRGEWDITEDPCIEEYVSEGAPECRLNIEPSSHLQVQPLKDSYRFGETVVLSCPKGEELNNVVERLMCLGGELAWSDAIPSCITQLRSP